MVTNTGALYPLDDVLKAEFKDTLAPGDEITEDNLCSLDELRDEQERGLREAIGEALERERMVAVGDDVVQKLRLGERELRRRKQRRR